MYEICFLATQGLLIPKKKLKKNYSLERNRVDVKLSVKFFVCLYQGGVDFFENIKDARRMALEYMIQICDRALRKLLYCRDLFYKRKLEWK